MADQSGPGYSHYANAKVKYSHSLAGDKLGSPCAVSVSRVTGQVAVADWGKDRILILSRCLELIHSFGLKGTGNNQFRYPDGVAINNLERIHVADTENNRIQIANTSGEHLSKFGSLGSAVGYFNEPRGIAIDEDNKLYICDSGNYRVLICRSDGAFLSQFGSHGDGCGQFPAIPCFLATSKAHNKTIVSDMDGNLHVFSHSGEFRKMIPAHQEPYNMQAAGVAIDSSGSILIGDRENGCIVVLNHDLEFVCTIGEKGQFKEIRGVAVSLDGEVVACDQGNQIVKLFGVSTNQVDH